MLTATVTPEAGSGPILRMQHITKRFPGVLALSDVSLDVRGGEVLCLVGENGAGKSTLMKIMSGVYPTFEGELLFEGAPVVFQNTREAQRHGVVIIHQELNLVPELTVYENIFLGREPTTRYGAIDRQKMRREAAALLGNLGIDINANTFVSGLRVGRQQLVEIAKALNHDARVLIMDEPTSALSSAEVTHLFQTIRTLKARGVAIIYISHRLDEVFAIADRITVLRDGKTVGSSPAGEMTRDRLISLMVGRELQETGADRGAPGDDVVLEIQDLSFRDVGRQSLSGVSLNVKAGEIVGVAGLMGSGRTELLEAIFGVSHARNRRGAMRFRGESGFPASPREAIAAGIGMVAEDRKLQSLVLEMSVRSNMSLATLERFVRLLGLIDRGKETRAVKRVIDDLSVKTPGPEAVVNNLSGGNQQKVVFGRYLLREMKLFLLDEPTRGVDVGAKAEIYEVVRDLAARGTAFLVVSSELPELLGVCDRIYVLCEGRVSGEFQRSEFDQEAIMEAATRFIGVKA